MTKQVFSSRFLPNQQLFLILTLASIIIFTLDSFRLLGFLKSGIYYFTNPITFNLYRLNQNFSRQFQFISSARFAAQENKALQDQIAQLLSENAKLRTSLAQTEALLAQDQHLDPKTYQTISARPTGLDRFLRIDKGLKEGVVINQAAVFKDNFIGVVVGVLENGASIRLLVDPDSKIAAFSIGKTGKAKGVLVGQFGSEMLLDKILHEEHIDVGDLVYSEGTEGSWPRGLILGRVDQVLEKENELFKQAKVKAVFDIRDLELVFLIR